MKTIYITFALLFSSAAGSQAEFRIWEDTKGNVLEGEFVTMNGQLAVVRARSGKELEFGLDELSEVDREYLDKVLPPKLSVNIAKISVDASNSSREAITCKVTVKQMDARPYKGKLTAILVIMGESMKTGARRSFGRKEHSFTLPDNRREAIEFASAKEEFSKNTSKSGNKYSGYLLVVWDRFGNPVAIESNRSEFESKARSLALPSARSRR